MLTKKAISIRDAYDKLMGKEESSFPGAALAGTPLAGLAAYTLLRRGGGSPSKAIESLIKGVSPSQKLESSMGMLSPSLREGTSSLSNKARDWLYRQAHGADKLIEILGKIC